MKNANLILKNHNFSIWSIVSNEGTWENIVNAQDDLKFLIYDKNLDGLFKYSNTLAQTWHEEKYKLVECFALNEENFDSITDIVRENLKNITPEIENPKIKYHGPYYSDPNILTKRTHLVSIEIEDILEDVKEEILHKSIVLNLNETYTTDLKTAFLISEVLRKDD